MDGQRDDGDTAAEGTVSLRDKLLTDKLFDVGGKVTINLSFNNPPGKSDGPLLFNATDSALDSGSGPNRGGSGRENKRIIAYLS